MGVPRSRASANAMKLPVLLGLVLLTSIVVSAVFVYRSYFPATVAVNATAETASVPSDGDAADDPAIWVDVNDPAKSLILGTDKRGGLAVCDLEGRQLQYIGGVEANHVDVRSRFLLGDEEVA